MSNLIYLSDICDFQGGTQPPKEQWSTSLKDGYVRMLQIRDFTQSEKAEPEYVKYSTNLKMCKSDDVLIARYGASLGKILTGLSGAYNVAIMKTIPNENKITKSYLYYFLLSDSFQNMIKSVGSRAAQAGFNKEDLSLIKLKCPSIEKQEEKCIILNHVYNLIDKRKRQILLLDKLVKSRFIEMFGKAQVNPRNFTIMPWEKVFFTTTGKLDSNAMVEDGQYPFFTCAKEIFKIDTYAFDCEALLLAGNNAAGIYDVKYYKGKFNVYQRTYVLRLTNSRWSYQLFKKQLEDKLLYLQTKSKGTNTRYLTMGILKELQFLVPPITLQNEFAHFVEQTDKSKLEIQKSLDKLEILKKSLMQQYFG